MIRATTPERNLSEGIIHVAEAILHYDGAPTPGVMYDNVYMEGPMSRCSSRVCKALNCPFERYPQRDNIVCINVDQLVSLFPVDDESKLPTLDNAEEIFWV